MNSDGIFSFLPKILGTFIQRKIEEKEEQELVKRKESIQEQENEV